LDVILSSRWTLCPESARLLLGFLLAAVGGGCDGDTAPATGATGIAQSLDPGVSSALLAEFPYYDSCPTPDDRGALRCLTGRIDLGGDGRLEVLALVLGPDACGSGGCTAFVLQEGADGYRVVARITQVSAPILAEAGRTEGWHDLIVEVAGGGAKAGPRLLRFGGGSYPTNASLAPPAAATSKDARVIIADDGFEAIAAASLLVPPGCAEEPAVAVPSVIATETLGGLRVGNDAARVERLLGRPAQRTEPELWGADGLYHREWRFPDQGIVIGLSAPAPKGPWQVDSLTLGPPAKLTSARGIGIGATEERVRAAYPEAIDSRGGPGQTSVLTVGSDYDGLIFGFDKGGRVDRMFLGAPAE
jgi:hypothetical protein